MFFFWGGGEGGEGPVTGQQKVEWFKKNKYLSSVIFCCPDLCHAKARGGGAKAIGVSIQGVLPACFHQS